MCDEKPEESEIFHEANGAVEAVDSEVEEQRQNILAPTLLLKLFRPVSPRVSSEKTLTTEDSILNLVCVDNLRIARQEKVAAVVEKAAALIPQGIDDWLRSWCTDQVVLVYIQAGHGSEDAAAKLLSMALLWRRDHKEVLSGDTTPAWQGDMRVVARGDSGHPVIFMSMQHQPQGAKTADTIDHMAAVLEAASKAAGEDAWGFDVVCDCRGFQVSKNLDPRPVLAAFEMLKHAFRGRLRVGFVVGAPTAFSFLWRSVKQVLPAKTQEKIRFVSLKEAESCISATCGHAAARVVAEKLSKPEDQSSWRLPSELSEDQGGLAD